MTYEKVKQLALDYSNRNAHFSSHKPEDPNHKAVVEMGEAAAPHLFRVMFEHPETTHFAYNVIPLLIEPPMHIVERMNTEAISKVGGGGFAGLDVSKMTEIYKQWAEELV